VKPYIPYDIVHSDIHLSMAPMNEQGEVIASSLRVPSWIYEADIPLRPIRFSESAIQKLTDFEVNQQFIHCNDSQQAMELIQQVTLCSPLAPFTCTQVLRQDIRSHHQGRSSLENRSSTLYECRLDSFLIQFRTFEDHIFVEEIAEPSSVSRSSISQI
jgi:hypothetical protein